MACDWPKIHMPLFQPIVPTIFSVFALSFDWFIAGLSASVDKSNIIDLILVLQHLFENSKKSFNLLFIHVT